MPRHSAPPCETALLHDADGNLTNDTRFAYAYDAENRMVSARPVAPEEGDLAVVNAYDHRHRRIMKRVERFDGDAWQTAATHTFVYDGCNIVLERIAFADGSMRTVEPKIYALSSHRCPVMTQRNRMRTLNLV